MQYPKPKLKKHRAKNNPVPTIDDLCIICDQPFSELHEVFYGRGQRQKSIKYKMQVRLCMKHHRTSPQAVHQNPKFDAQLKREAQMRFENQYSHDEFMKIFNRNYLDVEVSV